MTWLIRYTLINTFAYKSCNISIENNNDNNESTFIADNFCGVVPNHLVFLVPTRLVLVSLENDID